MIIMLSCGLDNLNTNPLYVSVHNTVFQKGMNLSLPSPNYSFIIEQARPSSLNTATSQKKDNC